MEGSNGCKNSRENGKKDDESLYFSSSSYKALCAHCAGCSNTEAQSLRLAMGLSWPEMALAMGENSGKRDFPRETEHQELA